MSFGAILVVGFLSASPGWSAERSSSPCAEDGARRKARGDELQKLVRADQEDRKDWQAWTPAESANVGLRDLARRKRVGEIFGEGCFSTAEDYAAAALIFQHGDAPDHYYQVFVWARRAVELGDSKQKDLMAIGLDRYLVSVGRKQLFASQAFQSGPGGCFCLQPVEPSFSDEKRGEWTERTLKGGFQWVDSLNAAAKKCPPAQECAKPLAPSPRGSVPGFW